MATNKQQLQLNNETLASILSSVLGLPSQESLKHGAYVWKKLSRPANNFLVLSKNTAQSIYIKHYDGTSITDLNELNGLEFDGYDSGIHIFYTITVSGSNITVKYHPTGYGPTNYSVTYSNGILTATASLFGTGDDGIIWEVPEEVFLGYFIDDNATKYPDGDFQDGYWYEKVHSCKTYNGTSTPTSSVQSITISNPFRSAEKVKLIALFTSPGYGQRLNFLYKNIDTNKMYASVNTFLYLNDSSFNITVTDESITFLTAPTSKFAVSTEYYWEVVGNK